MAAVPRVHRLVLLVSVLGIACAGSVQTISTNAPHLYVKLPSGVGVHIQYDASESVVADVIRQDLSSVVDQAAAWGNLTTDLVIRIHRDRAALRRYVTTTEHDWVDAWATHQSIDIQSTRASHTDHWWDHLRSTLVHELTHVVFFQSARIRGDWQESGVPFWFVEGMAVRAANVPPTPQLLAALTTYTGTHSPDHVLYPSAESMAEHSQIMYVAAGLIFERLRKLRGDDGIRKIASGLAKGQGFAQVFRTVYDRSPREFEQSWWNQIGQEF
jgi:hypothetical protein